MRAELSFFVGALGLVALTMVVYRAIPEGRSGAQDKTGRGGSFVLGFWVRNWFYWFIRPVIRVSLALRLSPLFYNILAVVFGLGSLVFFARGQLPTAGWMILLSGFADVMDGEVARGRGLANKSGAFLDSTLDRFSEFAAFIGMTLFFGSGIRAVAVLLAFGGSMMVSYTRARGESLGVLCKKGLMQRAERMLLLGVGGILDPTVSAALGRDTGFVLLIVVVVIAVGTVATSIYRTLWISRELQKR
ncbi:MAG: CDP-alcohol phosphatidyltransferase family protein [Candidatus Latescibacterota bacterium]|nr:MAG: CDP-alcohol phosphatidyltransferase family protein [Candidatus Latescibacterota bacterium]